MKVRVTKAFGAYKVGQVFDWADGMARIYLGRGMVTEVRDEEPVVEEAAVEPEVEQAVMKTKRKAKR